MKINTLTHAEETLMHLMWQLESAYLKDILAEYPQPRPHQNTVSTFLKILVDKKFLSVAKEGRVFRYIVSVPCEAYRLFLLQNLLLNYYGNSAVTLVKSLVEEKLLNHSDGSEIFGTNSIEKRDNVESANPITEFIEEITSTKKAKKKDKDKKKKKKNK